MRSRISFVLLLAPAALFVLSLAYLARPTVRVDVGDYYDQIFIADVNDPEVSALVTPTSIPWPDGATEIAVPEARSGLWLVTLVMAEAYEPRELRALPLFANGYRVPFLRRGDATREVQAAITADLMNGTPLRLSVIPQLPDGTPVQIAEVRAAPGRTYRWTTAASQIRLPDLGRGDWMVTLRAQVVHPDGQPVDATLWANGAQLLSLPQIPEDPRLVTVLVPARLVGDGDLNLVIRTTNVYRDPRTLGIILEDFTIAPAGAIPPLAPFQAIGWGWALAAGVYACLVFVGVPRWSGFVAGVAALAALAAGLALARTVVAPMLPGLAVLAVLGAPLLWLLRAAVQGLFAWAELPAGDLLVRGLLLLFIATTWLKIGGMLYPYFVGIDVSWHMDRVRWITERGMLPLLYSVNSPLNESTMPIAEWGPNRPVIPYSPWFHMVATVFTLLPAPLEQSANLFSALVDGTRLVMIALLARTAGLSERGALLASGLYAVLPVTYLLHSWGNIPTTFGLWWALAATTLLVAGYGKLGRPPVFALLGLLLLGALLIYTVAGVFMGLCMLAFVPLVWRFGPEGRGRQARAMALAGLLALVVALLVYYGQYILPILERTVPYLLSSVSTGGEAVGRVSDDWPTYLARHTRLWGYGLVVPLALTVVYLALAWRERAGRVHYLAAVAWCAVMLLFIPVGKSISLVDKHFWIAIPAMCVASAWCAERLWAHRPARLLVAAGYAALAVAAVNIWIMRVITVTQ